MPDPLTVAAIGFKVGSALLGSRKKRRAKKKLAEGRRLQRQNKILRAVQARRSFLRAARGAQAQALVAGVASGASVESSAVQGSLASIGTQARVGATEQRGQVLTDIRAEDLGVSARSDIRSAQNIEAVGSFAASTIKEFI